MFIITLFIIAQNCKPQKSPSIFDWINKLWYTHTVENYSVIKRNELSSHEKTWKNIKLRLLCERNPSEETIYYVVAVVLEKAKLET